MRNYLSFKENGDILLDWSAMPPEATKAIAEITQEVYWDGKGDDAREVKKTKFKLYDKKGALDSMAMRTYLGLLANAVRSALRSRHDLVLENLALRQQLAVLTRQRVRTRSRPADRLFWSWLSRYWPGWRSTLAGACWRGCLGARRRPRPCAFFTAARSSRATRRSCSPWPMSMAPWSAAPASRPRISGRSGPVPANLLSFEGVSD